MIGADPRALREMAATFDGAADTLTSTRTSVQVWVDRADIWRGLDNRQFADGWGATDSRAIANAATLLRRYADTLRANAEAQDDVSAAEGAMTGGSGLFSGASSSSRSGAAKLSGPGGSASIWEEVLHASDTVVGFEINPFVTVGDVAGVLGAVGLPSGLATALDLALTAPELVGEYLDPSRSLEQKILSTAKVGVDFTSGGLMSVGVKTHNPAMLLAGAATMTWGTAIHEAGKSDLSPEGFSTALEFVQENPWSVVEELGKATLHVSADWGKQA
ncbi:MAG: hypothetical protein U1C73_08985, partial [Dietzia sp.]|nr:hypothetical protein [Dietzia sp.]